MITGTLKAKLKFTIRSKST